jgi:hypothetical protein
MPSAKCHYEYAKGKLCQNDAQEDGRCHILKHKGKAPGFSTASTPSASGVSSPAVVEEHFDLPESYDAGVDTLLSLTIKARSSKGDGRPIYSSSHDEGVTSGDGDEDDWDSPVVVGTQPTVRLLLEEVEGLPDGMIPPRGVVVETTDPEHGATKLGKSALRRSGLLEHLRKHHFAVEKVRIEVAPLGDSLLFDQQVGEPTTEPTSADMAYRAAQWRTLRLKEKAIAEKCEALVTAAGDAEEIKASARRRAQGELDDLHRQMSSVERQFVSAFGVRPDLVKSI